MKLPKNIKRFDIVGFRWLDSTGVGVWTNEEDLTFSKSQLEHESVGAVFKVSDYSLTIVQSYRKRHNDQYIIDHLLEVPLVAILSLQVIKRK